MGKLEKQMRTISQQLKFFDNDTDIIIRKKTKA